MNRKEENYTLILSVAYLPNIQYFSKLLNYNDIIIEVFDTYQKQSYRNRSTILGSNGPLDMVIPVKRPDGNRTKTRDILIDYAINWRKTHWKAIISAYKHSPFFDIFAPELEPIYQQSLNYLVDWNLLLLDTLLKISGTVVNYRKSDSFIRSGNLDDYRDTIHPKSRMQRLDPDFSPQPYYQVFDKKFGFVPNLSFLDLLFNEGPQAIFLCRNYYNKGQQ